ncbi:MAG: hypothetical protein A3F16_04765 [Deltaproteobacteria bacterium RIFCSPHIGHO2_12_FULL_43_9]|nr:MAG: hypothetical protein A3F16_04765 [Deltaproteobacteria bacterium RIFCSPHIGHO2_12_FULL_43_9]
MKQLNAGIFILLACLAGCATEDSSKVKQESIYTTYNANYDDENKSIYTSAFFNFGGSLGTYLRLDGNSTVTFNGETLDAETTIINQVIYKYEKSHLSSDQIWKTHSFLYRNNDGKEFKNEFTFPNLITVRYVAASIDTNSTLVANWNSSDKIGHDQLYLSIVSSDKTKNRRQGSEENTENSTSGKITVPQNTISELGPGTFNVNICREHFGTGLNTPPEGGSLSATTCSKKTEITILNSITHN